jgi:hypothetical protein
MGVMRRSPSSAASVGFAILALAAGRADAQTAHAPAPAAPQGSTPLEGVVVAISKTPPTVASTYPAAGSSVDPGVLVLKVTFDQRMDPQAWRYAKGGGDYPDCLAKPRLLADAKTFVLLCTTTSSRTYSVRFNEDGETTGFTGEGHRAATPFELTFTTMKGRPVSTLPDALIKAGLHDDEGPVEGSELAKR